MLVVIVNSIFFKKLSQFCFCNLLHKNAVLHIFYLFFFTSYINFKQIVQFLFTIFYIKENMHFCWFCVSFARIKLTKQNKTLL